MSAFRTLRQGIALLQNGNTKEGARLVKSAVRDASLAANLRALGYIWLAETVLTQQEKIDLYNQALLVDPDNQDAQQRLGLLLTPPPPPAPPPSIPEAPITSQPPNPVYRPQGITMQNTVVAPKTNPPPMAPPPSMSTSQMIPVTIPNIPDPQQSMRSSYHIVGILDGPNGAGSGFFVAQNGILVTSRYVVGDMENLTIELDTNRQLQGRVVRSVPDMDIAFVYVEQQVNDLLPITPFPTIMDNAQLSVITHKQQMVTGRRRETGRMMKPHWFPTDIVQLPDAGGGPVFDERGYVVGMITRSISSNAAYVYGVHMAAIRRALEVFFNEMRSAPNRVYCNSCGSVSKAAGEGGYYCEVCGTIMPFAEKAPRIRRPDVTALYEENSPMRCTNCGSQAGIYLDKCLRCGKLQNPAPQQPVTF